ncbi:MAG: amidase family protein [Pontimonas sp.]
MAGRPALALPVMMNAEGLPVGVQLIGRPGGDTTLLQLGHEAESALGFSPTTVPPGF